MSEVRIVTDSISDVPDEILTALGILMVPITVRFGQEELRDREDISIGDFMARLVATREPVRTSQPSPGAFLEAYRDATRDGKSVVSIHASSKFSGTYQSACVARDIAKAEGRRVEVLDTRNASMAQGWAVIQAARAALAGLGVERVVEQARWVSQRVRTFLTVDTLAYLERNGRLGRVAALVGSVLGLRPILTVTDGELALADATLGAERGFSHLVGAIRRSVRERARVALGIVHAGAKERALELQAQLARLYEAVATVVTETGPAIAANTGPGAYGAFIYEVG